MKNKADFYTTVEKALDETDPNWQDYQGLIVVGSHTPEATYQKLLRIRHAREDKIPFLGICFGMQLMVIEYARHVLDLFYAETQEVDPETDQPIFTELSERRTGIREVTWKGQTRNETHWHQYTFNIDYLELFKEDWEISITGRIVEVMQLIDHPHFLGIQFHPEYGSTKYEPHPILKNFLEVCKSNATNV